MTHSERDQRIRELTDIERAHPEAVKHERAMVDSAQKMLDEAIDATAGVAALWAAFIPVLDQARRDGLVTEALHHAIVKHRAAMYDPAAVPALGLKVEEARSGLFAALVKIERGQTQSTTAPVA